ncbi:alpha/beta fold hydrolase [Pseudonocardia sp. CA-107938]|uniref:alpha/beta fold hydrolase n=1 Tax=Pseudonocardia sp. CA-107938 TaxID=3240021 RepID=UPI003D8E2AE8
MTPEPAPTVVLVHGMWHGGWAWDRVIDELAALGHRSVAVTLPGTDRAAGDPTFRGHCAHLTEVLAGIDGDVVLVGHSYSGALLTEVGDAPNVRAMVFVSAFLLEPGESVASVNDAEAGSEAGVGDIDLVDDQLIIAKATAEAAFYNDCSPEDAASAAARLTPEHVSTRTAVVTRAAWRTVPAHFLVCTLDRACTPAVQHRMAARIDSVSELRSSHSPMLSMPGEVARTIVDFAAKVRAR